MKFKSIIIRAIMAFLPLVAPHTGLHADDLLRHNYKKNNYSYTGTERIRIETAGELPLLLKLKRVSFPDGVSLFILHLDVEDSSPWKVPKNASISFYTASGVPATFKNSFSSPNPVAPEGIDTPRGKRWWNTAECYIEEAQLKKLLSGVSGLELTKRWASDGVLNFKFKGDAFSAALKKQYEAVIDAAEAEDVSGLLSRLEDAGYNRMAGTVREKLSDGSGISLSYIYYAAENTESYDLHLFVPSLDVPGTSGLDFILDDGSVLRLTQEDCPAGEVTCYPDSGQLKDIMDRAVKLEINTPDGKRTSIELGGNGFRKSLSRLYNAIQTIAIL